MTRPSEFTRERIIKAAVQLFAQKGYDGASIRTIVAKARVNQAAINYHFAGKDGLYRAVLGVAFRAMTEHQVAEAENLKAMSREEALRQFVRRQLRPLDVPRRAQPLHADLQLGDGAADRGVPQVPERGGGALHGGGDRPRAPLHAWRRSKNPRVRRHLADGPMQRFRAQSRAIGRRRRRNSRSTSVRWSGLPRPSAAGPWAGWRSRPERDAAGENPAKAAKIPFSGPSAAQNRCLKFNHAFEKCDQHSGTAHAARHAHGSALSVQACARHPAGRARQRDRRLPVHPVPVRPRAPGPSWCRSRPRPRR